MRPRIVVGGLAVVMVVLLAGLGPAQARYPDTRRQSYDAKWSFHKTGNYYYKVFRFKPRKKDTTYKQQFVIYKPARSRNYLYWYNPDTKKYWARCPTIHNPTYGAEVRKGKDFWSILPSDKRKASLARIRSSDYGPITPESPVLPGSRDNTRIEHTPTHLPES
jgi:hypothetical protein